MRLGKFGLLCGVFFATWIVGCGGFSGSGPKTLTITTGGTLPAGVVGSAYSLTLSATGGTPPYSWSVSSGKLPAGLALSASGAITGTPTATGSSTFSIQATDSSKTPQTATLAATLAISTVSITTTSPLPSGIINTAYTTTLAATGGTTPYTWSISAGTLPAGLTLSSAGVLSGTPTVAGSSSFTIQAKDSSTAPQTATLKATLVISDGTVKITTTSPLPAGTLGVAYPSVTFAATGGTPPYTWSTTAPGALPAGLTLSPAGVLSGTPTAYGPFSFTVQATDSAATPQSVSAPFTLQIGVAPLAITTTTPLTPGNTTTAYSLTLAASGGAPPYQWSVSTGTLPAGLTLSPAGVLSGTPTTLGYNAFTIAVQDSEATPQTASLAASLVINPPLSPTPLPNGTYSFLFSGTSPQGAASAQNALDINGTFTLNNNVVSAGYLDENSNTGPPVVEQAITGGSVMNFVDGLGYLTLDTGGATMTFALAIPTTGSDIRISEFDDMAGTGVRGSGLLKAATAPSLPTTAGSFAFLVAASNAQQQQEALACSFQTDGNGNLVSLRADANELLSTGRMMATWYNPVTPGTTYGSYVLDAKGRGLLTFILGGASFHFSFYEVSPSEWFLISIDPAAAGAPLAAGSAYQQTGSGSFTTASIPTTTVVEANGLAPASSTTTPNVVVGVATSNGTGTVNYAYDQYDAALIPGQTLAATYQVDATTGRTTTTNTATTPPILYLINPNLAFILFQDNAATSGIIESQTGSPFANASFTGNYLGGTIPLSNTSVLNEAGLVTADGNGNLTFLTYRSDPTGLNWYDSVTGTYAVESSGRVVATTPDGVVRIFYVVSPAKVAYLTGDGGGYLGSFEQ